ncbi:Predicted membrane protein [Actinobacillus lignieresii]|nr:Predicted membrane protein [Actinobacillus lignieresii]
MQNLLTKFKTSEVDILILRLSIFIVFATFGIFKWFDFEVEALKPLISTTWLNFLYDWFGFHGTSYLLG